jgi:hypothetical protein
MCDVCLSGRERICLEVVGEDGSRLCNTLTHFFTKVVRYMPT